MFACEACGDALSTTVGKRPVCFCDHLLCESCVPDDGSCPLCNLKTDLAGDERVSRVFLKQVSKVQELFSFLKRISDFIPRNAEERELTFAIGTAQSQSALLSSSSSILNASEASTILGMFGRAKPRLELLYRASRDGDAARNFHAQCDYRGPTLVVVSAKGKTFGGFTTSSWTSPATYTWYPGDKNFLFHMDPDFVLRCVDGSQYGAYSNSSLGPVFGGGALELSSGCLSNTDSYCSPCTEYPSTDENNLKCINDLGNFKVTDYEVYSVGM